MLWFLPEVFHCAICILSTRLVLQVAFVASFVSKLSDTVSSEIGKVSYPSA
jgi:uncharacterized membrane protein